MIRDVLLFLLLVLAMLPGRLSADAAPAAGGAVAIVYPELGEPWRAVFSAIIEGVEEQVGGAVRRYPLAPGQTASMAAPLRRSGARVVIALGRQGLRATSGLPRDLPVVAGGILSVSDADSRSVTGISLTPDPAILFAQLKSLLPGVRRVLVIYNPAYNQWLLDDARAAARAQGLELVAQEARDTASAARLYEVALAGAERSDALWLPQDPTTVDDDTILPLVLRAAWSRSIPVFSSSFPHVRRGVLFSLHPDNRQLGRALGRTAQRILAGEPVPQGLQPLQAVLTAVNVRTAAHLDIDLGRQQRRFDFVFPEP